MPYYSKPKKSKNIKWFYAALILIAIAVLYYSYVLHPVRTEVVVEPPTLVPDGQSEAVVMVVQFNRIGVEMPGEMPTCTCEIMQGQELVSLKMDSDGTKARITAGYQEGMVEIRVSSPVLAVPQTVWLRLERPRA